MIDGQVFALATPLTVGMRSPHRFGQEAKAVVVASLLGSTCSRHRSSLGTCDASPCSTGSSRRDHALPLCGRGVTACWSCAPPYTRHSGHRGLVPVGQSLARPLVEGRHIRGYRCNCSGVELVRHHQRHPQCLVSSQPFSSQVSDPVDAELAHFHCVLLRCNGFAHWSINSLRNTVMSWSICFLGTPSSLATSRSL